MAHITCPRCQYKEATPAEGFDKQQAARRLLLPLTATALVFVWGLLYLTLPVITTIRSGSINWMMTLIVALMWPLAGFALVAIFRVARERAMAAAYVCDRCGARWPRRESHRV